MYRGFGPKSSRLEAVVRSAIDYLRSSGINVCLSRVLLPVLDEEVEPAVSVEGRRFSVEDVEEGDVANIMVYGVSVRLMQATQPQLAEAAT